MNRHGALVSFVGAMWLLTVVLAAPLALGQSRQDDQVVAQLQDLRAAGASTPAAIQALQRLQSDISDDAPYPQRRELIRTQLAIDDASLGFDQKLALMQVLRDLAVANGDDDTVSLMDINRIYMSHADDDIGKYLEQLNEVRSRIRSEASVEVMHALELSYGNMYFDAGNFDTALRHQLAALESAAKLPLGSARATLFRLATIAELYVAMDLNDSALEYVDKAFALQLADMPVANRMSLLGARSMAFVKKGQLTNAEKTLEEAEALVTADLTAFMTMRLDTLRAELRLAQSRPDHALRAIEHLESLASAEKYQYFVEKSRELRGEALMQLGQVDAGLALMQGAAEYFKSKGQVVDVLGGMDRQIRSLNGRQLHKQAVPLMDQRRMLWSQLFRHERGRAIAELEADHSARELEQRIGKLSAQNQLQEERLRSERLGTALTMAMALLAMSLAGFLYISRRRTRSERDTLSNVVRFDSLTGAYSRYQFQQRSDVPPVAASGAPGATGMLLLDLDNFKATNDQYGHEAGDAVLIAVVQRIRRALGDHDELYRWGGEEFLVILHRRDGAALQLDVRRLLWEIESMPVVWNGQSMPVSVSGGYVPYPLAAGWAAPLGDAIRWADAALYLAKNAGRRRVMQVELTEQGRIELKGRRPIDMVQLEDWQRHGHVHISALLANHAPATVP